MKICSWLQRWGFSVMLRLLGSASLLAAAAAGATAAAVATEADAFGFAEMDPPPAAVFLLYFAAAFFSAAARFLRALASASITLGLAAAATRIAAFDVSSDGAFFSLSAGMSKNN